MTARRESAVTERMCPSRSRNGARGRRSTKQSPTPPSIRLGGLFAYPTLAPELAVVVREILTGTPRGVGLVRQPKVALRHGGVVQIEIEGMGTISNRLAIETARTSRS